jgi:hypothetical protein
MAIPSTPAPTRRRVLAPAVALALLAAACTREVEVTVVVESTPLLDRARMDASPVGEAVMGARLTVKVPKYGSKPFWAVKDAKSFVRADDVAAYPLSGSPAFVTEEKLAVNAPGGAVVKELRLGSPVNTWTAPALADHEVVALVENGVVIGFCDAAAVSPAKPPASLFAERVHELVRGGDFEGAARFLDAGVAAYPRDPTLEPWIELLRRAADPLAFPPPGQRTAVRPEPPVRKGAPAYVAPLAAAVLGAARPDASPVTVVRQNTELRVLDVVEPYARVQLAPAKAPVWSPVVGREPYLPEALPEKYRAPAAAEGQPTVTTAGTEAALYVRLVDLQGAPSTQQSLVSRAQAAQSAGNADEPLELLSRALGLGGAEPATYEALFDAAVAAGDLERAMWAAVMAKTRTPPVFALRGAAGWSEPAIVDVALVHGCSGPLQPGGTVELVGMRSPLRPAKPGQCLAIGGTALVCEDCALEQERARKKVQQEAQANARFLQAAGELYPLGPFLRITVENRSFTAGPPSAPLFLTYGKTYWIPILALGAYERVTLYVQVNARDLYGLSLGEEDPGEPDDRAGETISIAAPKGPVVWVGEPDLDCEACEREGQDGSHDPEESDDGEDASPSGGAAQDDPG